MEKYSVGPEDSIPGIARDRGFFWKTLWEHPENAELKALRKDPNMLVAGDEVFVPEPEERWESRPTEALHAFRKLGDPVKFRLVLRRMGKPRKDEDYVLVIDGQRIKGTTDGDGLLECFIPGNARCGTLLLNEGQEEHALRISRLDPVEGLGGVQQRLNNLGFSCGREDGEMTAGTRQALKRFQAHHGLEVTGEADPATVDRMKSFTP